MRRLSQLTNVAGAADMVNFLSAKSEPVGYSPLHLACIGGHVEIAELLIRRMNAHIDILNNMGETPLHLACKEGHKGVIERLLLARARTDIQDYIAGSTPLHVLA